MLRNYPLIAVRNLHKPKAFSVNIIGVANGLACVLPIALYTTDEVSYFSSPATQTPHSHV